MAITAEQRALLTELAAAWENNPTKSLMQMVLRAAGHSPAFSPVDASDEELLYGIRNIAATPPRSGP